MLSLGRLPPPRAPAKSHGGVQALRENGKYMAPTRVSRERGSVAVVRTQHAAVVTREGRVTVTTAASRELPHEKMRDRSILEKGVSAYTSLHC